ncbi:MAG: MBL fold metallo-hydrolase [Anaerolineae bacterium]
MGLRVLVLSVGPLQTNCYIARCDQGHDAVIIDAAGDADVILRAVREQRLAVRLIVCTHAHFDHVGANEAVRAATGAPIAIHRLDAAALTQPVQLFGFSLGGPPSPPADRLLEDGEVLTVGACTLQVLHTPGHTPGGISLYNAEAGIVFSGDALFCQGIGRTDLPGGDPDTLLRSIRQRLLTLPPETMVYPGHGPATTIGAERDCNPFLLG